VHCHIMILLSSHAMRKCQRSCIPRCCNQPQQLQQSPMPQQHPDAAAAASMPLLLPSQ
jgi:hypothetical protein